MAPKRTSGRNRPGQAAEDSVTPSTHATAGPSTAQAPPAPITASPAIPSLPVMAPLPPAQLPPFQMVPGLAPPAASATPQAAATWLLPPTQTVPGMVSPAVPEYLASFEASQAARVVTQLLTFA